MRTGAVVALAVVFQHELPVAFLDDATLERELGIGHVERGEIGRHHLAEFCEIRRLVGDGNEDVAAGALGVRLLQAVFALLEIFLTHRLGADKAAVRVVAPLMIGADEALYRATQLVADAEAAVAAGVVVRVDLSVLVAGDDQRVLAELDGEIVAGVRNLAIVAGEDPVLVEEVIAFELKEILVAVEIARQSVTGFVARAVPAACARRQTSQLLSFRLSGS